MQPITAIFILLTMKALLLSAACINQTAPQETAAPYPAGPSGPGVFLTTPSPTLPTMTPPAAAATVTTTLVPMTPIQINDIISLDNNLYYVYAEDSSVYYLREVEENADGSGTRTPGHLPEQESDNPLTMSTPTPVILTMSIRMARMPSGYDNQLMKTPGPTTEKNIPGLPQNTGTGCGTRNIMYERMSPTEYKRNF